MSEKEVKDIIHGKVDVQIGKNGLNTGVIDQITQQFKKRKFLKIRFLDLHFFESMDEASEELAKRTNARIIDVRGKTCVLRRKSRQS